jgi:hypothetical protein
MAQSEIEYKRFIDGQAAKLRAINAMLDGRVDAERLMIDARVQMFMAEHPGVDYASALERVRKAP